MASQRAVSSADGRKMPPAIGDAVAPFGSEGGGGRGMEPFTLLHQDTTFQGYSKNPTHCKVSVYIWVRWCNSGARAAYTPMV
jgi:hypothetical protein